MDITIRIVDSHTGPGRPTLTLEFDGDNGDFIEADTFDKIIWQNDDSKIYSYRIEPKSNSQNIWDSGDVPPSRHTRNRREAATVSASARGKKYRYNIFWKTSETSREFRHDPIIAIRTSAFLPLPIIGTAVGVMVGALGFMIFRRMKNAKNWNSINELEKRKTEIERRIEELKKDQ